ncbi:MAG TPA: MoxR family ATPase [Steroidobacteraceae bacterium]|nr:MoxR family ATPase [Steroidobacteraceae bacterium]
MRAARETVVENSAWVRPLQQEIARVIVGQKHLIDSLLIALLTNGHVLLEGVPGLAKTLALKTLAGCVAVRFKRLQFTPDMLPADIVGTMIYSPQDGVFRTKHGPIFSNLILADEINRAPAKVQSALLEAMQERQVTIGGQTHILPRPFFVMATQNPIEQEGTYPLPEAQTDRFLFKLLVNYPSAAEEGSMLARWGQVTRQPELAAVSSGEELLALRAEVDKIHVAPAVQGYILSLVRATRALAESGGNGGSPRQLNFGASPRASLAFYQAGRALAWLRGQDYVSPALVQELAPEVIRHRVGLTYETEAAEITADKIVAQILEKTPVPAK